jgi:hypothetical protein
MKRKPVQTSIPRRAVATRVRTVRVRLTFVRLPRRAPAT